LSAESACPIVSPDSRRERVRSLCPFLRAYAERAHRDPAFARGYGGQAVRDNHLGQSIHSDVQLNSQETAAG